MAERETRVIEKRCARCGKPLSAIVNSDDEPITRDGDAIAVCTNDACNYQDDEVLIDPSDVKTPWQVEP